MKRFLLLGGIAASAALALGCNDQPALTAPATTSPPAAGPSSQGAVHSRFPNVEVFAAVDFERDRTFIAGLTADQVASFCQFTFDGSDISQVFLVERPTGTVKVQTKDDEISVVIWEGVPEPDQSICDAVEEQTPFATGTMRYTFNESQRGVLEHAVDVFRIRGTGFVTNTTTGQLYRLLLKFGARIQPDGTFIGEDDVVQLTPIAS